MVRAGVGRGHGGGSRLRRGVEPAAAVALRGGGRRRGSTQGGGRRSAAASASTPRLPCAEWWPTSPPTTSRALVADADLVLDGTDNFETRFLLNDACLEAGIPWVYGACVGAYGLALAVRPRLTPCLRCVLRERPAPGAGETCDTAGVVAPVVHVVAGLQAAEALKLLAGREADLLGGLVTVDLWSGLFEVMDLGQAEALVPRVSRRAVRRPRRDLRSGGGAVRPRRRADHGAPDQPGPPGPGCPPAPHRPGGRKRVAACASPATRPSSWCSRTDGCS